MSVVKPHICPFCSKGFTQRMSLKNHIRDSPDHGQRLSYSCVHCHRSFNSEYSLGDHLRSVHAHIFRKKAAVRVGAETAEVYCRECNIHFQDSASLRQHRLTMHNWCFVCSRDFVSWAALSTHLRSLAHAPRVHDCPFCKKSFKSPSGVAHHIESGCHKFTRHQVTAAVQAMDIVPKITTKTIEGSSGAPVPMIITYIPTSDTFNGNSYSCFLCTRTFRTLPSLSRHLNSAAHDDNEFRCPKCKAEFTLISGFVQHLESRACGLAKDKQVENYFTDLADRFSGLLKM